MGVTNLEIIKELREMRSDVHALDTAMAVHVSECLTVEKDVARNTTDLNGNGKTGIKQKTRVLWQRHIDNKKEYTDESSDRRKFNFDLKSAAMAIILTGVSQVVVHMVTK